MFASRNGITITNRHVLIALNDRSIRTKTAALSFGKYLVQSVHVVLLYSEDPPCKYPTTVQKGVRKKDDTQNSRVSSSDYDLYGV